MSLDTQVLLVTPRPVTNVVTFVNSELLGKPDALPIDTAYWNSAYVSEGHSYFGNAGGQGLEAWFMGYTGGDGPVKAQRFIDEEEDDQGEWHEVYEDIAEGAMMLSFDTAYGMRGPEGGGCSDLHAYFILRLAQEFGLVHWKNEFTGTWHRLDGSSDLALNEELVVLLKFGDPRKGKLAVEGAAAQV